MDGSDLPPGGSGQKPTSTPPGSRKRKRGADASPATPAGAGPSSPSPTTARRSRRLAGVSPAAPAGEAPFPPSPTTARRSRRLAGVSLAAPAGAGTSSPSPTTARRSKRGADASPATPAAAGAGAGRSSPSRTTTTRRGSKPAVTSAVSAWVRSAAAGELWRTTSGSAHADKETMREAILHVRRERSVLPPDGPGPPYREPRPAAVSSAPGPVTWSPGRLLRGLGASMASKQEEPPKNISYLSALRKQNLLDPTKYQASVPEWKNAPSEKDIADYRSDGETLQKLGEVVCPLNMNSTPTSQLPATSCECKCAHPGSKACVGVHVKTATSLLKNKLGEQAFSKCGLDAMGEQTLRLWTRKDKKKFGEIARAIPRNEHGSFMKIALEKFSSKKPKKDLVNYYYNVFLPRRLGSLTRAENTDAKDVDTDGDSDEDDSEKKRKSSGSSRRSRK